MDGTDFEFCILHLEQVNCVILLDCMRLQKVIGKKRRMAKTGDTIILMFTKKLFCCLCEITDQFPIKTIFQFSLVIRMILIDVEYNLTTNIYPSELPLIIFIWLSFYILNNFGYLHKHIVLSVEGAASSGHVVHCVSSTELLYRPSGQV